MSMMDSRQSTQTDGMDVVADSLPPRHTKHGRRRQESDSSTADYLKSRNSRKGFYYIQIILYTFLALIAAIIIYYYVNTQNQEALTDKPAVDPLDNSLEQQAQNGNHHGQTSALQVQEQEAEEHGVEEGKEESEQQSENNDLDKPEATPDVVRNGQKKEYPEQHFKQPSGESERVEEPPQPERTSPQIRTVHTVQAGETLYSITMRYYNSKQYMDYLAEYNGIKDPTKDVKVGMNIQIPELNTN